MGIFGSGNEARTNLEAICAVRSIERVKVYSVTKEHRDRFAEEMTELLNVEVQPVSNPEAVVRGSDIVMCATNASQPVFDGNWLEPGQLVTTIANTDGVHRRTEADATTMIRSDFIVLNNKETAITNQQRELLDLVEGGKFGWDKVCELGQVLTGDHPGRKNDQANYLLQEQYRRRHSVRRRRRVDLRRVQETGVGSGVAERMVRRRSQRMDGQGLHAVAVASCIKGHICFVIRARTVCVELRVTNPNASKIGASPLSSF